jgi:hypothetical protein
MARYFPITLMTGRLYPQGISEWGPWDATQLRYVTEDAITIQVPGVEAKVDDPSEILRHLDASAARPLPTRTLWIREGLEEEVRRIWERGRSGPGEARGS